jgi:hypothetical protein
MIAKPYGPARLELLGNTKKRRVYTVRVTLGLARHCREFSTWTKAVKYAYALPHFRGCKNSGLPIGNYVFLI